MAKGPSHRIVAKNKASSATAEIGVIWTDDQGRMNIQFATEEDVEKSQGRKAAAGKCVSNPKNYFFNVYENKPRPEGGRSRRDDVPTDDSDIDF